MNQPLTIFRILLIGFFIFCAHARIHAQEIDSKRFIVANVTTHADILLIDSLIRSLEGVHLLRVDYNTRNCVGLFDQNLNYNKLYFETLLAPYGYELECYTNVSSSSALLKPILQRNCRFSSTNSPAGERGTGACCLAGGNGTVGCENAACEAVICALDVWCCDFEWDGVCATAAINNANGGGACAGVSDCPGGGGGGSGLCCSGNGTPGCENAPCEAAICALDPFCCSNNWDILCADNAIANASAGGACASISDCPGPGGGGNTGGCCTSGGNGTVGCENASCEAAVCAADPFCCNLSWDGICATIAFDNAILSGACSGVSDCPTGNGGGPVTAGDCVNAINVCTDLTFSVNPNGFGNTNEIPPPGSYSNPNYGWIAEPTMPWGSTNEGCLRSGELNSTWMVVNIQTGGVLEFSFGDQLNFHCYDWIMYPFDSNACTNIFNNSIPPIRCNWNLPCESFTGIGLPPPAGGDPGNFEPGITVNSGDQFIICFSNYSSAITSVPLQFGGTAIVSCTPLPVELISFSGNEHSGEVHLQWTTSSEINNDFFSIERSYDGASWETIATINGAGDSNHPINYVHVDKYPAAGTIYYRLFQQDFDGATKALGEVAVTVAGTQWTVFPNPATQNWTIQLPHYANDYQLEIQNARGQFVDFEQVIQQDQIRVKLKNHRPGIYLMRVFDSQQKEVFTTRLVAL